MPKPARRAPKPKVELLTRGQVIARLSGSISGAHDKAAQAQDLINDLKARMEFSLEHCEFKGEKLLQDKQLKILSDALEEFQEIEEKLAKIRPVFWALKGQVK